ncbi:hypothetical protein [Pseudonocardia pini]|uniref:hypothetical protein n=1 Tax=Pseudonocardia pini TaxID=2758030 RepID=UPI0015F0EEA7|nr:hypothetical protein [Pseudonocardia pini]
MGKKQQGRGQKRAAKVAARKRRARPEGAVEPLRPITTLPGLDDWGVDGDPARLEELEAVEEMRYTVAEIRTIRQVGPHDGNPEWLEVLEANVGALADSDETDLVVEIIDDRVRRAVVDTLGTSSPEPAREEVRCLVASDGETAGPEADPEGFGGAPAQWMALAVLLGWLGNHGPRPIPTAARTRVPEWAGRTLGERPGEVVAQLIGIIGSEEERHAVLGPEADALEDDFLAGLMWIAAGLVALYGDGDANTYLAFPEGVPA